jgi:hypothetical protein
MDRDLGALRAATSLTDSLAFGHLYQFGRVGDGHQLRTSVTTPTQSSTPRVPVPNTDRFITTNPWYNSTDPLLPIHDLWNETNTGINDIWPPGYRLPTIQEWDQEINTWRNFDINNPSVGAFNSLKLVFGGVRLNNGFIVDMNTRGSYYSSRAAAPPQNPFQIQFTATTLSVTNQLFTFGHSIRLIKI